MHENIRYNSIVYNWDSITISLCMNFHRSPEHQRQTNAWMKSFGICPNNAIHDWEWKLAFFLNRTLIGPFILIGSNPLSAISKQIQTLELFDACYYYSFSVFFYELPITNVCCCDLTFSPHKCCSFSFSFDMQRILKMYKQKKKFNALVSLNSKRQEFLKLFPKCLSY